MNDLHKSAMALVAILGAIMKMSDDVKNARNPLNAQGKLLFMQNSLQKNGRRMAEHAKKIAEWKE